MARCEFFCTSFYKNHEYGPSFSSLYNIMRMLIARRPLEKSYVANMGFIELVHSFLIRNAIIFDAEVE